MILYTPVPVEQVLGLYDAPASNYRDVEYRGVMMSVEPVEDGKARIVRLNSTNPYDYLNPQLMPGSLINLR